MSLRVEAIRFGKVQAGIFLERGGGSYSDWDRDFFNSEAFMAMVEGLGDFDESRGIDIVKFLERRIGNRLKNAVRKEISTVGKITVMVRDGGSKAVEDRDIFERVMDRLAGRDRDMFYLYFIEGRPMVEIGQILGISTGRVHQIIRGRIRKIALEVIDGPTVNKVKV